jgi:hypothetical protein
LLKEARDWARKRNADLSSSERTFIRRSTTERRRLVSQIAVLAGFVILAVTYASYLVIDRKAEQVLAARLHNSPTLLPAPEAPEQSEMSMPLRVWLPASQSDPTIGLAPTLYADATARRIKWVSDPDSSPPTHIFRIGSHGWAIIENSGVIDSGSNAHELLRVIPPGSSVFVEFPPPASLLRKSEFGDIELTSERETADYALVGRYTPERGMAYAWVRTGRSDRNRVLPSRTSWIPHPEAGEMLIQYLRLLWRTYAWHALQSFVESRFAYRLEIRDALTGLPAKKIVGMQKYRLVLRTSASHVSPRYVYVFTINSGGKSTLLFPSAPAGSIENRLPVRPDQLAPPEIVLEGSFEGIPPYGLDTFFLLTTTEPLPNPWILEADTQLPTTQLPTHLPASSFKPQDLPVWSVERLHYEYVAP